MVVGRDFKSMLRTVFTAKLVISKTPVRTSTGCVPREGRDQPTMECEQSGLCTQKQCCDLTICTLEITSANFRADYCVHNHATVETRIRLLFCTNHLREDVYTTVS